MTSKPRTLRRALRNYLPLLLFALGCSAKPLPPVAEPDKAREAIRTALEAWKTGGTAEALRAGVPAIYFTDLRWQAGDRLLEYHIADGSERFGQSVRISVTLQLQDNSGMKTEKRTTYNVDTDPAIVIVPADM